MEGKLIPYVMLSGVLHISALAAIQKQIIKIPGLNPATSRVVMNLQQIRLEKEEEPERAIVSPKILKPRKESPDKKADKKISGPKIDPSILRIFPYPFYLKTIQKKIASNWQVSSWADSKSARMARFRFRIDIGGVISDIEVVKDSNDELYDLACQRAIELSDPFPPLPVGFQSPTLTILFDFELTS
ncbi:TonB C-terminal domain-containing protein [Elusimicrobiota bacterium]